MQQVEQVEVHPLELFRLEVLILVTVVLVEQIINQQEQQAAQELLFYVMPLQLKEHLVAMK